MPASDEIFDVVDEQDCVIGQAARADVHARALKHRAVHVLQFNSTAELLVQKRSPAKDTFPGRYDSSASGHLASGEDYDACAVRELQEELGLNVLPVELKKRFKIAACSQTGWEFVWVYTIHGDYRPVINPAEITSAEYRPVRRIRTAIVEQPELWAPSFIMVFQEMDRRGLLPVTG